MGILIAAILGFFLLFYLGGMVGQLQANYQRWLLEGGLTGQALIAKPSFQLSTCVAYAFTPDGLKGVLFIFVITVGFILFIKLRDRS